MVTKREVSKRARENPDMPVSAVRKMIRGEKQYRAGRMTDFDPMKRGITMKRKRPPLTRQPKLTHRVSFYLSDWTRRELQKLSKENHLTLAAMIRALVNASLMIRDRRNRGIPGEVLYGTAIGGEQSRAGLVSPCVSSIKKIQELSVKRTVADLVLNPTTRVVTRGGKPIKLSALEFRLLHYLMMRAGEVVSRADIIKNVWVMNRNSNVVNIYINYLRRKVDGGRKVKLFHTVRGAGFTVKDPWIGYCGHMTDAEIREYIDRSRGRDRDPVVWKRKMKRFEKITAKMTKAAAAQGITAANCDRIALESIHRNRQLDRLHETVGMLNHLPPGYADRVIAEGRGKDRISSRKRRNQ